MILDMELASFKAAAGMPMKTYAVNAQGVLEATGYNNPLEWWKVNEREFPNIAKLAKRVLCIPATSAPAERLFSHAGLIVSKARAALKPENVASAVLLHDSWHMVEDLL